LGLQSDWSKWTSSSEQTFQALPPGEYQFQVRARSRSLQVGNESSFTFSVLPPWYISWWASVIYMFIALGFVWVGISWQAMRQRAQLQVLEGLVSKRTEELAKSHNLLEDRVRERTFQLESVNHELTAQIEKGRRIEAQLQESESRYRSIVEVQQESLVRFDFEGKIEFANAIFRKRNGYSADDLIVKNLLDFFHPEDQSRAKEFFLQTFSELSANKFKRLRVVRPDGSIEWEEWNRRTVASSGRQQGCIQAAGRNVTELVNAEMLLREKENTLRHVSRLSMLGEMVANITHEIHQPLGAISNFAFASSKLLDSHSYDAANNLLKWNEQIIQQVARAEVIIRRMGGFARQSDSLPTMASVNTIVRETVDMLAYELSNSRVAVDLDLSDRVPEASLIRIQVEQVLVNLIRNGIDAMRGGDLSNSRFLIATRLEGSEILVSVRDFGPGVDPAMLSQIFQPFQTSKEDGLGLGLAISRSIIEGMNGRIFAENADPGLTVAFTISINKVN
jgi:PAS domain S-box-containing protein